MAHHNLYTSLNLDSSFSPEVMDGIIQNTLSNGGATSPEHKEELEIAQKVLGDGYRRSLYDARLNDPEADEITLDALRELAQIPSQSAPEQSSSSDSFKQNFDQAGAKAKESITQFKGVTQRQAEELRGEYAKSSKKAITVTGVAAGIGGLVVGGILGGSLFGGGSGVSDAGGAERLANEFLELTGNSEAEQWIGENVEAKERGSINSSLGIGSDFSGVDSYFGESNLRAGDAIGGMEFVEAIHRFEGDKSTREVIEAAGVYDYALVPVLNDEKQSYGVLYLFQNSNGDWKLGDMGKNSKADPSEFSRSQL